MAAQNKVHTSKVSYTLVRPVYTLAQDTSPLSQGSAVAIVYAWVESCGLQT